MCPHASAVKPGGSKLVDANGHSSDFSREGMRTYTVATNHKATVKYAAYVLRLRVAFAIGRKGPRSRRGSFHCVVLPADAVADGEDNGVGVYGSVIGSRVSLA